MNWYIYKGEDLKRDKVIKFPFYRTIRKYHNQRDLVFRCGLQYSEAASAPVYPAANVKELCKVMADFRGTRKSLFKPVMGVDGNEYFHIDFLLCLYTDAANLKFSLEFQGEEMGSVEATYI